MFKYNSVPYLGKLALATSLAVAVTACGGGSSTPAQQPGPMAVTVDDVVMQNAAIAFAAYSDSVTTAEALEVALTTFVGAPTMGNLDAAQQAWLDSREPYGQSEVYRFRAGPIDALDVDTGVVGADGDGPEGRINGWPLGEALIDYVATGTADGDDGTDTIGMTAFPMGIIQNTAVSIDEMLLTDNFELGGDERYVTTGYHAIEFLLWGQDTNDASPAAWTTPRDMSGGQRPVSDYSNTPGQCTNGVDNAGVGNTAADAICVRRGEYLLAAAALLVSDLTAVRDAWDPTGADNHYAAFVAGGDVSLGLILEGMGRMSAGELAGERIFIAATNDSQEDEHSCFSDNTHRDILLNALGVQNSYLGTYTGVDGSTMDGAGINDLVAAGSEPALDPQLTTELEATQTAAQLIVDAVDAGMPFDTQLQDAAATATVLTVVDALVTQVGTIEDVIAALGVTAGDLFQDTEEPIQ